MYKVGVFFFYLVLIIIIGLGNLKIVILFNCLSGKRKKNYINIYVY